VAGFIGSPTMNLCSVHLGTNGSIALGEAKVAIDDALASAARSDGRADLVLGLRPESLEVGPDGVPARVEVVEELGADAYVFCVAEVAGEELKLVARTKARNVPRRGDQVALSPRPNEAHLFDSATGERVETT
jgi:multiple sugar transport system ATP-binding protein